MLARDQCVAFAEVDSSVSTMICSTWSTLIVAGRPGRGSSTSPSRRRSRNLERHFLTVGSETPSRRETLRVRCPCRTLRHYPGPKCEVLGRFTSPYLPPKLVAFIIG